MSRIVIIGAGAMGLAAAHRAVTLGHQVDLIEADAVAGGMAAHFDFGGLSIERFYHFVCKSDAPTFDLMRELGIGDRMRWRPTSMGYFMKGRIHPWGDPISLLRFPHLSFLAKLRTGIQMFLTTKARSFSSIEHKSARQWLEGGSGREVYQTLWKRLMELKFYELADDISASWIATRVRRIGNSRRSIFQEELGYIEGGSQTLVDALVKAFTDKGGRLHLSMPAQKVVTENGRVTGVQAGERFFPADAVISTVPTPYISTLVPDLPAASKAQYDAIRNIGVVCLLFKLKTSVSRNFWVNIVDETIDIPGIIEFSNLRPVQDTVVYVPYYMPTSQPKWQWSDDQFIDEAFGYIRKVNPAIAPSDLLEAKVGRLKYAQPVCEPNFYAKLPPIQTPITGLQIADTCYYYPEDRGIAESIRYGRRMAEAVAR
ncbi:UDP-galactopyranose mutase [Rhizobium sp. RU35A]|uniref:NAD(P)/FAD-dependent oxidoreductase n=1 Tax=Rhizobium straminoryzae TaxID=1387186 RepID=A0A549T0D9_9HYPH|nr:MULTISPECIES: NAD(P)/FAD-dependent oxidoreductase [Rhizobium]TRL35335.1 NAD(P)/FAD-dependent oxidoreductase [Rhizobium straminoryzae]SIQ10338.1 UDP-galactopyranose mutase [Rhizobium sp. RU35A]